MNTDKLLLVAALRKLKRASIQPLTPPIQPSPPIKRELILVRPEREPTPQVTLADLQSHGNRLDAVEADMTGGIKSASSLARESHSASSKALSETLVIGKTAADAVATSESALAMATVAKDAAQEAVAGHLQINEKLEVIGDPVAKIALNGYELWEMHASGNKRFVGAIPANFIGIGGSGGVNNILSGGEQGIKPTTLISSSQSVTDAFDVWLVDASAGNVTLTLPISTAKPGRVLIIKKINTTGGDVFVLPIGSDHVEYDPTGLQLCGDCRPSASIVSATGGWPIVGTG